MKAGSRIFSIIIVIALLGGMIFTATAVDDPLYSYKKGAIEETDVIAKEEVNTTPVKPQDDSVVIWYNDAALTDYIETAALSYQSETGVKIKPVLVSGVEYLEQINHASIYEGEVENGEVVVMPDLYITTHDNLMKEYLAGLATEITDTEKVINMINYPETSIHAITCNGKHVAYPLYYETNFFLYNKTYMANIAKQKIKDEVGIEEMEAADAQIEGNTSLNESSEGSDSAKADSDKASDKKSETGKTDSTATDESKLSGEMNEADAASDETGADAPMGNEDATNDPAVLEKLANMIPATIDDILTFANNYDAPEQVEAVFKWDVSDIFYNYFFVGNYMDVGGEDGDDNSYFNIYNQQAIDCLTVYSNLNQFFSIDSKAVTYDSVLQEFLEGKTVFTVATTDAIAKIEEAKKNGEFEFDYGVTVLPDLSSTLKARGLSVTSSVAINGYSDRKEEANDFAKYLSFNRASELYKRSGKIACIKRIDYEDEEISNIMMEYEKSVPLPKMIEAGNYWVQLEIAFTKIWNGAAPDETLKELSDTIGAQIDEIEYHVPTQEKIKIGVD